PGNLPSPAYAPHRTRPLIQVHANRTGQNPPSPQPNRSCHHTPAVAPASVARDTRLLTNRQLAGDPAGQHDQKAREIVLRTIVVLIAARSAVRMPSREGGCAGRAGIARRE